MRFYRLTRTKKALGLITLAVLALGLISHKAQAGLIGAGNTVQALFLNGTAFPLGLIPTGGSSSDPTSLAAPVNYPDQSNDGFAVAIADTQIVITNLASGVPFCFSDTSGTACVDVINGLDFKFTGENILGVSVNPSSAAGFLPVTGAFQGNTHLGLQLLSNNEIEVDLTGDLPNLNDQLVLDLTFTTLPPPTSVPEPGTLALLGSAFVGLIAARRRKPAR
jgi:hypothetical protein